MTGHEVTFYGGYSMTKNILLLGRTGFILEDVQHQLQTPNIQLFAGTGIENVRSAFDKARIDAPIHWYLASQERYPVTVSDDRDRPPRNCKWVGPFLWMTIHYDHQFEENGLK